MRIRTALLAALALTACSGPQVIVLKNPATGEIKECRGGAGSASLFPLAQAMIDSSVSDSCAKGYQAAGWARMN